MKLKLIMLILSITLMILLLLCVTRLNKISYECHANIRLTRKTTNGYLSSNITVSLFPSEGYYTLTGNIYDKEKSYVVRRDGYFSRTGVNKNSVVIEREVILPGDNIDNDIWEKYFIPRPIGVRFYLDIKPLISNLYYVAQPSSPLYICVAS